MAASELTSIGYDSYLNLSNSSALIRDDDLVIDTGYIKYNRMNEQMGYIVLANTILSLIDSPFPFHLDQTFTVRDIDNTVRLSTGPNDNPPRTQPPFNTKKDAVSAIARIAEFLSRARMFKEVRVLAIVDRTIISKTEMHKL